MKRPAFLPALRLVLPAAGMAFLLGVACGSKWQTSPSARAEKDEALSDSPRMSASAPAGVGGNPRARLMGALSTLDAVSRGSELRALARTLALDSPEAAWALRDEIASVGDREDFCLEVLALWASRDAGAAVRAAAGLPAGRLRTACMAATLGEWGRSEPEAALSYAGDELAGAAKQSAITSVVAAWAEHDGPAATAWAMENLSNPAASGAFRAAVQTWTDTNPAAASQWVAGLPPGNPLTTAAASALVSRWGEQTPAEAAAWISEQGVHPALDAAAAQLAAEWAATDPMAATEWAITLERTLTSRDAAARAIGEWAAVAPGEAAEWLARKTPGLPALAEALHESLGAGWAAQDPAGAASWLRAIDDGILRAEAATPVFNTWAVLDPAGLEVWLDAAPAENLADTARSQLALIRSEGAPAAALALALEVSAPAEAADLGRRILDNWRSRDLAAANQWRSANPEAARFIEPLN